ncbi:unnamed protein product [Cuscuta campestris]|uniref:Uncharacterized protein n=1 Tax=Cuscuta campestris TaxID=132261 RepID=A0A484M6I7_9ASTE|nr:unnamed protein product [Cuscuta campestris]
MVNLNPRKHLIPKPVGSIKASRIIVFQPLCRGIQQFGRSAAKAIRGEVVSVNHSLHSSMWKETPAS